MEIINNNLEFFFRPLSTIKGVGPKFDAALSRLLPQTRIVDLLFHIPVDYTPRPRYNKITDIPLSSIATITLTVVKHISPPYIKGRKIPTKIICTDGITQINLVFFNYSDYIRKKFPLNDKVVISGKLETEGASFCMIHPDYITNIKDINTIPTREPVYPLTYGITNKMLVNLVANILNNMPYINDWDELQKFSFQTALRILHTGDGDLSAAKSRLAFDELFARQLSFKTIRDKTTAQIGIKILPTNKYRKDIINALDYKLTNAQERVLSEIDNDLSKQSPMTRLIQGDVGSGKTIVATLALISGVEVEVQGAFMVPTGILAQQHKQSIDAMLKSAHLETKIIVDTLSSNDKGKIRNQKLENLKTGKINILIGTHAIFEPDVEFKNLGLVVIDEQHKFGVKQRLALVEKTKNKIPNMLQMTATPIPRTLCMTSFGDMDLSIIDEMPKGRVPIQTSLMGLKKIDTLIEHVKTQIANNEIKKLYWVCPLVEESETLDLSTVIERYEYLNTHFPNITKMVHGKMKQEDKDNIMSTFANPNDETKILVATTVIEVGVNIPEATVMVIEHAQRFGLSSLHQLRGRIGRGAKQSICILLYKEGITAIAQQRLNIIKNTTDGFKIADSDLQLRGSGEILGTQQSGDHNFKIANLLSDMNLVRQANVKASTITTPEKYETMLKLFDFQDMTKNIKV